MFELGFEECIGVHQVKKENGENCQVEVQCNPRLRATGEGEEGEEYAGDECGGQIRRGPDQLGGCCSCPSDSSGRLSWNSFIQLVFIDHHLTRD